MSFLRPLNGLLLAAAVLGATSAPVLADPPLAGRFLVSDTHGQPFCRSRRALQRFVLATIQHEQTNNAIGAACVLVPYNSRVDVLADLPPFGSRMHVVRAIANTPFQRVSGYTYSVGLFDPRRYAVPSPFDSGLPQLY